MMRGKKDRGESPITLPPTRRGAPSDLPRLLAFFSQSSRVYSRRDEGGERAGDVCDLRGLFARGIRSPEPSPDCEKSSTGRGLTHKHSMCPGSFAKERVFPVSQTLRRCEYEPSRVFCCMLGDYEITTISHLFFHSTDSRVFVHDDEEDAYFRQISSVFAACRPRSAAAMAQSLFSVALVSLPSLVLFPLSKCVVGREENKKESTYQPQYRRVKWTLLVRAIAIQQESSSPLLPSFPFPLLSRLLLCEL